MIVLLSSEDSIVAFTIADCSNMISSVGCIIVNDSINS